LPPIASSWPDNGCPITPTQGHSRGCLGADRKGCSRLVADRHFGDGRRRSRQGRTPPRHVTPTLVLFIGRVESDGHLDIIVNNAGVEVTGLLDEISAEVIEQVIGLGSPNLTRLAVVVSHFRRPHGCTGRFVSVGVVTVDRIAFWRFRDPVG
jgi:NAD(P)-dependent dehydrogenase (short-subunit alcohol dehydrogenase family)